jgi:hypothetical protein
MSKTTIETTGTIEIDIMNREGHQTRIVIYDEVADIVRDEMGQGKWANVQTKSGKNKVYTQYEQLRKDILANQAALTDTQKIQLITALTGGNR